MKDWNDAHRAGINIREVADNAKPAEPKAHGKAADHASFELVYLDKVEPLPVDWLWQDRLPRRHLTLFASDPGMGKSQVTIDLAARLSRGAHWPLGPTMQIASSIFLCSEDSVVDTIRPRAEAAGADLSRIAVLKSAVVKNGKKKSFNLGEDLDVLSDAVNKVGNVGLVTIDAITSYMGKIDSHRNTDVRVVLEPLFTFAEMHNVSVLGVMHIPKAHHSSALKAFLGSVGFIATCRCALLATHELTRTENYFFASKIASDRWRADLATGSFRRRSISALSRPTLSGATSQLI